ncbi:hypothetical protein MOQ_004805 [Trypanosoma cruzi marinkellei]|uniref:Uncharacterized protein n=1 Tax=Trypanosoma cruzi marinkellei TaxID=85056 RepID=K2NR13_TRYCR|nr:hypothetical protein MOQ_004805 [Trypanosoma cruzi marinkellei]
MSVEDQQYDPAAYGGQHMFGSSAPPIACCQRSNACESSLGKEAGCLQCRCPAERPPCCCETFQGGSGVKSHSYRGARHPPPPSHHHQQQHYYRQQQQQQQPPEGGVEQLQQGSRSSSRRCFCCVPEQEELQEYDRLEKEQRYRSMRAERQKLQAALYDDLYCGMTPRHESSSDYSYRPNTAQLLRYSQGSLYQRAVAMEQERRRRELRKEIEARKRELSARGPMHQPVAFFTSVDGVKRPLAHGQRTRGRAFANAPVRVCPTTGLKQHQHPGRDVRAAATKPAAVVGRRCESRNRGSSYWRGRKHHKDREAHVQDTTPLTADTSREPVSGPPAAHSLSRCRCKEVQKASSPAPPLRGGQYECRCKPCRCCSCAEKAHSAGVVPTVSHTVDAVPEAPLQEEDKEKPAAPLRAAAVVPRRTSSLPACFRRTAIDYGRKIYITDDAHLSRRAKVIELLEQDGYVRPLTPKTRSPSAPLPEKAQRWATTRSTSAHRVCA